VSCNKIDSSLHTSSVVISSYWRQMDLTSATLGLLELHKSRYNKHRDNRIASR